MLFREMERIRTVISSLFNGDKVPTPIIDFDLKQFFPAAAKAANITEKTVVILVQIDETGQLKCKDCFWKSWIWI